MNFSSNQSFYEQYCCFIQTLCSKYPFIHCSSAGQSVCGRELYTISFGGEDAVFFLGGVHAMEYITVPLMLMWLEQLCEAWHKSSTLYGFDPSQAFNKKGVVLLPCMNPDGIELAFNGTGWLNPELLESINTISNGKLTEWNANINGVDLNHNFDAGWQIVRSMEEQANIHGPSPRRFGGFSPESEPETQVITKLCRQFNFRQALAFHTQGEEIYWQYENTPRYSEVMAQILSITSGYRLVNQEGLASHGGFKDWFITEFARPAFTIEFGRGKNPLPLSMTNSIYRRCAEMIFIAALM